MKFAANLNPLEIMLISQFFQPKLTHFGGIENIDTPVSYIEYKVNVS